MLSSAMMQLNCHVMQIYAGLLQGLFVQAALSLKLRHPLLHSIQDIYVEGGGGDQRALFQYEYNSCSSLRKIITSWFGSASRGLPLAHVRRVIYQLVQAISHLHSKGILHGGLCPESLMMLDSGILKVGGLCYASMVPKVSKGSPLRLPPPLHYMSPELILADIRGLSADVWAIGCIAGELASGLPLFPGKSESNQLRLIAVDVGVSSRQLTIFREREDASKILKGIPNHDFHTHFREKHKDLDRGLLDFLYLCLQPDGTKRATINELLNSSFLREAAVECDRSLADEEERVRAMWTEAKSREVSSSFMAFAFALKGLNARLSDAADSIAMPLPPELISCPPPGPSPSRPRSPPPNGDERISPNRASPFMFQGAKAQGGLSSTGAALFGGPPPSVPWVKSSKNQIFPSQSTSIQQMPRIVSAGMTPSGGQTSPMSAGPKLAPLHVVSQPRRSGDSVSNVNSPGLRYDGSGRVFNEFGDELDPDELPGRISDSRRSKIEGWLQGSPGSQHKPRDSSKHHSSPGYFAEAADLQRRHSNAAQTPDRLPGLRVPSLVQGTSRDLGSLTGSMHGGPAPFDHVSSDIRTSNSGLSILTPRTSNHGASNQSFALPPHHSFLQPSTGNTGRTSEGSGRPLLSLKDLMAGSASQGLPGTTSRSPTNMAPLNQYQNVQYQNINVYAITPSPTTLSVAPALGNLSISRTISESYAEGAAANSLVAMANRPTGNTSAFMSAFGGGGGGRGG